MRPEQLNGIFLAGRFKRIEQVAYGPNHESKPGQLVSGMFRIVVGVGPDHAFEQSASFNRQDLATYDESVVSRIVS